MIVFYPHRSVVGHREGAAGGAVGTVEVDAIAVDVRAVAGGIDDPVAASREGLSDEEGIVIGRSENHGGAVADSRSRPCLASTRAAVQRQDASAHCRESVESRVDIVEVQHGRATSSLGEGTRSRKSSTQGLVRGVAEDEGGIVDDVAHVGAVAQQTGDEQGACTDRGRAGVGIRTGEIHETRSRLGNSGGSGLGDGRADQ